MATAAGNVDAGETFAYARQLLVQNAELMRSPRDTDAAVQARIPVRQDPC
ncbi:hypothetical protein [Streptomyces sp. NPDC058441]